MPTNAVRKAHLESGLRASRTEVLTLFRAAAADIEDLQELLESFYLNADGNLCQHVST